jgi:hypothetical protein
MKKVFLFIVIGGLIGCQKSTINELSKSGSATALYSVQSTSIDDDASIFSELIREDDQYDNDMNEGLYLTALSTMEMMAVDEFKTEVLNKSNYDASKELKVEDLLGTGSFLSTFESNLSTFSANTGLHDIDNVNDLSELMLHPTGQYYPVLIFYNMDETFSTNEYIIAIGDAVSEDDEIPAWYVHSDGSVDEILVDESDELDMPLIIVSNGTEDTWDQEENPEGYAPLADPKVDAYRINFRYEKNTNSEYRMILTARNTSNQWGWQVFSDINNAIHKNAVNSTTFNGDVDFPFAIAVNGTPANVSFLTYEYDWYTTPKPTNVPGLPLNLTLTPKMKYNNEWYQRATLDVINGPSSITITSKGFITFKNLI